jgi:hypothetical protein
VIAMGKMYYIKYIGGASVYQMFCTSFANAADVAARHCKGLEVEVISITEL